MSDLTDRADVRLLSIPQAAKLIGVSHVWLREEVAMGNIRVIIPPARSYRKGEQKRKPQVKIAVWALREWQERIASETVGEKVRRLLEDAL